MKSTPNTTFVGREAAAKLVGMSCDQFERAASLLNLEPLLFVGVNIRRCLWLTRDILNNTKQLKAHTRKFREAVK